MSPNVDINAEVDVDGLPSLSHRSPLPAHLLQAINIPPRQRLLFNIHKWYTYHIKPKKILKNKKVPISRKLPLGFRLEPQLVQPWIYLIQGGFFNWPSPENVSRLAPPKFAWSGPP